LSVATRVDEREQLVPDDRADRSTWTKGGNDYAGCSGAGITFNDQARQTYWLRPAELQATVIINNQTNLQISPFTQHNQKVGVFGVNSNTRIADIGDGTSNVIFVSERRVFNKVTTPNVLVSSDGWAFGGPATMFSTRLAPHSGLHYDEADSPHDQIVQVLLCDGSVKKVSVNIDLRTWQNLGNMSQGSPIDVPFE
jgi:hypothetical protein